MVLPIEGEMPKGRGGLYFMKKKYINPEIKTIELLSNTMMLSISGNKDLEGTQFGGTTTGQDADAQGRRNDWADPWN